MRVPSMMRSVFSARGGEILGATERGANRRIAQCRGNMGAVPITREQLAGWDQFFEPLSSEELALFDLR